MVGSSFKVILDAIANRTEENRVDSQATPKSVKSLRILLVEDHGDTRHTLSRLLTLFGHQISVADNTRSALEIMSSQKFDVVLCDIGLPDGTGL
jgi:PleD family two-component response regulator